MKINAKLEIVSSDEELPESSIVNYIYLEREFDLDVVPQVGDKIQFFMNPMPENSAILDIFIDESEEICTGIFIVEDLVFYPDLNEVKLFVAEQLPPMRTSKEANLLCSQLVLGYGFIQRS